MSRKKAKGNELKGLQTAEGRNDKAQQHPNVAQILLTLTQVYITVLGAFLSLDCAKNRTTETAKTTRPPQG